MWRLGTIRIVAVVVTLLIAAACTTSPSAPTAGGGTAPTGDAADTQTTAQQPSGLETPVVTTVAVSPIPAIVASLTTEEKVGQLLMPMLYGSGADPTDGERQANATAHGYETPTEIVSAYHLGGVIYLQDNVQSAPQLTALSDQLQRAATQSDNGIGLLIAIDQEGGTVSRISDEVTTFPSASELAHDPRLVREAGYVTGQQVQQQGVNVVLAPVADVVEPDVSSFIGDRSFGDDPDQVAILVAAAIEGLQQSGVAAAVKHWPGHGATRVDSHLSLPTVDVSPDLWDQRERVPFASAIDRDVAIVLVGHLALPQLDSEARPATVSPVLIDELLRGQLGFDGVVMTDALNMGAVSGYGQGELVVASVNAGADIILIPPSLQTAAAALVAAAEDGTLSAERLDEAVTRVLELKHKLGLLPIS